MSNPILNERSLQQAQTWAPPSPADTQYYPPAQPPINDGPVSPWQSNAMTVGGTITATAVLLVMMLAAGAVGWVTNEPVAYDVYGNPQFSVPGLALVGVAVGFGVAIFLAFKPHLAKFLAPVYALAEGYFVGSISRAYEAAWDGIVLQAVGATIGVFAVMLVLYATGAIKVTDRMRSVIMAATMGVMLFYLVSFVISLFGANVSFLSSPSLLGIGFSILVAGLAAFNLLLDFDFIERGVQARLGKNFEWYAAFGLLVTVVWLYLELLRLLSKLRSR